MRLTAPAGKRVRPTSERVRGAIFSVLGLAVEGARVLDLFAGSGAFGLEALSRGAASVQFVDRDPRTTGLLVKTVRSFGAEDVASVMTMDALRAIRRIEGQKKKFEIVFLDPPYGTQSVANLVAMQQFPLLLVPGGLLVIEREASAAGTGIPEVFASRFARKYGDTVVEIFNHK